MPTRKDPPDALLRLALRRAGVLTRAQVKAHDRHGKAQRRWIDGWTTMAPGYYCIEEPTWLSWCWAGLLRSGETGVISGAAAGHLHGFVSDAPSTITVFHARSVALAPMGDDAVSLVLRRGDRQGRATPTRASVEVALLDLAGESNEAETVAATTRALAEGMTKPTKLLDALEQRGRVRHHKVLAELCAEASGGVESVLEWRFLQDVVRAHRLPEPARQLSLLAGTRSDNVWEEHRLVVELDGRAGHEEAFRDMDRDNRVALRGLTTLRYGWHDVTTRACAVAAEVVAALGLGGWRGPGVRCSSCR
ncbi:endonuclease domain-containing protein [Tessaracoccus sp. OS52]|uniref:DUF559 domain-containing protein n=1 Tax=Tessaracoccus sp. OS52 TaxID=2886691 RepID=UPI001D11464B|nr:DUF559 domain-containing protein [Tessaracoccus sp. OS52]MCC2594424.1 endonuclease domain-containing protein [Tessaracoccus sp. OS52]